MAPEGAKSPEDHSKRRSMLGVTAYLLVPGERRRRAAGHFGRAALEAARGARALYVPRGPETLQSRADPETQRESPGGEPEERSGKAGRQQIRID